MGIDYNKLELLTKGSVKDIHLWQRSKGEDPNKLLFTFTDDTSVKDYGKLPFKIPYKGEAICQMSVANFKALEALGINTVFVEQVADNAIVVNEVAVLDPIKNDMTKYRRNVLIPLEIIARNVITQTSSARKRLSKGTLHPSQLGLSEMPKSYPVILPMTFIDGSTKLVKTGDEYLPWDQLIGMCRLPMSIANQMNIQTRQINEYALTRGAGSGFLIFDFKVEYAFDKDGKLILTDVPLAVDEITCAYTGPFNDISEFVERLKVFTPGKVHDQDAYVNTSKQIVRDHYDAAEPEWVKEIEKAKEEAKAQGLTKPNYPIPNPMPEALVEMCSEIFRGLSNAWCQTNHFKDIKPLEASVKDYKAWAEKAYNLKIN